jgi:hypothetical protein
MKEARCEAGLLIFNAMCQKSHLAAGPEGLMIQVLATVLPTALIALAMIISAIIFCQAVIYAARIARKKEDHNERSKLTMLLRVSPGFAAPIIFFPALVAVFVYIPFISDYAFWLMVAAYTIMAGYRPPSIQPRQPTAAAESLLAAQSAFANIGNIPQSDRQRGRTDGPRLLALAIVFGTLVGAWMFRYEDTGIGTIHRNRFTGAQCFGHEECWFASTITH